MSAAPDIYLIQPPAWGIRTPPLSLLTLAAYARSRGHRVSLLDLNIGLYRRRGERYRDVWREDGSCAFWLNPTAVEEFLEESSPFVLSQLEEVRRSGAPLVGLSVYESSMYASVYLARQIKRLMPNVQVILGGPQVSPAIFGNQLIANDCVDLIAIGEGEETLAELLARQKAGHDLSVTPGTMVWRKGAVSCNPGREPIGNLSELPLLDFSGIDFFTYDSPVTLPILASRGCPNHCLFCNERTFWTRYRCFTGARTFSEIRTHKERWPHLKEVYFHDSLLNGNLKELEVLADLLIENPLGLTWRGQAVVRGGMDRAFFRKLFDSGCRGLSFGLETASPSLMQRAGKRLARSLDLDRFVRDAHESEITCTYNLMFGIPGETPADAAETLEFMRRNRDYIRRVTPSVCFCCIPPGCQAYEAPAEFGIKPDNAFHLDFWESTDGTNTYPRRLAEFEAFLKLAAELGIETGFGTSSPIDGRSRLAEYQAFRRSRGLKADAE